MVDVTSTQLTLLKFWHAVGGLYVWEYFTTLDYEWMVIRRRLPYRRTIWIYSFARFTALLSIILFFFTANVTTPINCQVWIITSIVFECLSAIFASLLIVIRTIAIWNRNKVATVSAMTVWVLSIGFHFNNIVRLRFEWVSSAEGCQPAKSDPCEFGYIPAIVADMALLLIVLVGLFVLRRNVGGAFGLARLLWKQGIIWLVLGSAIEIPPLVFTLWNWNEPSHGLFEIPSLIVMTIATTRMHRSLIDFARGPTEVSYDNRPLTSLVFTRTKRTDAVPASMDLNKVSMRTVPEQRSKNDGDSSTVFSTSEQIPQIIGDPSKLDLTPASAHPMPTVLPPSLLQAEGV